MKWKKFLTLAVEDVTANAFPNCHGEIDVESNACNSHACVTLVCGSEIGIVMVVMMVTGMFSRLADSDGSHLERRQCHRWTRAFSILAMGGQRQKHATLWKKVEDPRYRE